MPRSPTGHRVALVDAADASPVPAYAWRFAAAGLRRERPAQEWPQATAQSASRWRQCLAMARGQRDDKACAAVSREFGCDGATMQVHDLPADIQPQAHTGAVAARVGLVEAVEDVRAVLGRDAQPVIADRDLRHLPVLCRGDVDGPPIRAVLDGVAHEVDQHLLDA